ncbi:protein-glutamine glutaminase family protein [Nocardia sp. NPDC057663]|uniref:protein-glutamine glutaminase family protein n=1 Tax=Nocardia sp. NPDC057663 TaxID=3346201 RepID=UPI00366BCCE9
MIDLLRDAANSGTPVIVTENDAHEIIDVRAYIPDPNAPPPPPFPKPVIPQPDLVALILERLRRLRLIQLLLWFSALSRSRAQQIFDEVAATSCDPATIAAPCIPFMYPDDGCWARAHEMCRLMIGAGLHPRKVWIQGQLSVDTRNSPDCFVGWAWHVAPTLRVRGTSFPQVHIMVIDPAIFTEPVTEATWKGVQNDPNATLTATDASDFYGGSTDPSYTQTNTDLARFRLALQLRTTEFGPPPYAHCP